MALSPAASPSSPSVRFTALELPVTTRATKIGKAGAQKAICNSLKKGSIVWVGSCRDSGFSRSRTPSASPRTSCQVSLWRAMRPRDSWRTTFR